MSDLSGASGTSSSGSDKVSLTPFGRGGVPWATLLRVLAVLAGSAVWVQLIGSLDMWTRFDKIGIAPTSTVALLPRDLLFAAGVRSLAAPLVIGLIAFGALVLWPTGHRDQVIEGRLAPVAQQGSPRGQQPPGLKTILGTLALLSAAFVLWRPLSTTWTIVLLLLIPLAIALIYEVVVNTDGFGHLAVALFVGTAVFGGLLGVGRQYGEPPKLDIAVALRKDGSAIGGYYLGRTSDSLYLLTTSQPGGKANNVVTGESIPEGDVFVAGQRCRPESIAGRSPDCYVQQVVGLHLDDVAKFAIGPKSVRVGPRGYEAARVLAQVALLRADEEIKAAETTTTSPPR